VTAVRGEQQNRWLSFSSRGDDLPRGRRPSSPMLTFGASARGPEARVRRAFATKAMPSSARSLTWTSGSMRTRRRALPTSMPPSATWRRWRPSSKWAAADVRGRRVTVWRVLTGRMARPSPGALGLPPPLSGSGQPLSEEQEKPASGRRLLLGTGCALAVRRVVSRRGSVRRRGERRLTRRETAGIRARQLRTLAPRRDGCACGR